MSFLYAFSKRRLCSKRRSPTGASLFLRKRLQKTSAQTLSVAAEAAKSCQLICGPVLKYVGITTQYKSMYSTTIDQMARAAIIFRLRLAGRLSMMKIGIRKRINGMARLIGSQPPTDRFR